MLRKQINENLLMLKKLVFSSSLLTLSTCVFDAHENGELCVYTVRELEQVVAEMNGFLEAHPSVKLTCPWDENDKNSIVCDLGDGKIGQSFEDCQYASWQVLRESTSILLERLKKEGKETKADVLWGFGITHLLDYELEYGLADYKPKGIENIEDAIKNDFTDNLGQWYIDPVYQKQMSAGVLPKWVGITAYMNVFCVNEAKMKEEYPDWTPEDLTWENFIKPECGVGEGVGKDPNKGECLEGWSYEGLISMPRPDKSGTGSIAISALLHHFKNGDDYEPGWNYLEKLDKHIGQYTWSGTDPCRLAADYEDYGPSEIAVAITGEVGASKTKRRNGQNMPDENLHVLAFPVGTAGYNIEANAVIKKDAINPRAHALMNWGISNEAFLIYIKTTPLVARPDFVKIEPEDFPKNAEKTWATYDFKTIARSRANDEVSWTTRFCPDDNSDKCRNKKDNKYPVNENYQE